jgi:hypothetical protein
MILAPNNGAIGIQPAGTVVRCINRDSTAVVIGNVVVTSFNHTSVIYPPAETPASFELSPFSCIKLADGNADPSSGDGSHANAGYIGVVTALSAFNSGAQGQAVQVQFGGIATALVRATTNNVVIGSKLFLSDTAGRFGNEADSANPDTTVALALGSVTAAASANIPVLLFNGPIDGTATALT